MRYEMSFSTDHMRTQQRNMNKCNFRRQDMKGTDDRDLHFQKQLHLSLVPTELSLCEVWKTTEKHDGGDGGG